MSRSCLMKKAKTKKKRAYQDWPSKNKFFCGGRCISGPDRKLFWTTFFLIILPEGLFLGTTVPSLLRLLSVAWIVVTVNGLLTVHCLVLFFVCGCMDPGIIPRQPPIPGLDENPFTYEEKRPPPFKNILVDDVQLQIKYCETCNLYRPPRAHHCRTCDNCVDRFDHHCPWLGNCVGKRNYRYFLGFVFATQANVLWVMAWCIVEMVLRIRASTRTGIDALVNDILAVPFRYPHLSFVALLSSFCHPLSLQCDFP
jgi:palmitoyltransferase ZDHHC9/14/18